MEYHGGCSGLNEMITFERGEMRSYVERFHAVMLKYDEGWNEHKDELEEDESGGFA